MKVPQRERGYCNERDAYLRLEEFGFTEQIDGFWIPKLVGYCDELWTIEMSNDLNSKGQELFQHYWPKVKSLMASLESIGIYYLDPQLDNIKFPDL